MYIYYYNFYIGFGIADHQYLISVFWLFMETIITNKHRSKHWHKQLCNDGPVSLFMNTVKILNEQIHKLIKLKLK